MPDTFELAGYEGLELHTAGVACDRYRGRHTETDKAVWIETPAHDPPDPLALGRLHLAWNVGSKLSGEHLMCPIALERAGSSLALVSEDWDGEPLDRVLARGLLPLRSAIELGINAAEAVGSCHAQGVVHNALRPENVLVVVTDGPSPPQLRLTGFGTSSRLDREPAEDLSGPELRASITYFAPEQTGRTNRGVDHRADLYSLGVLLHEMLTGRPPFASDDPLELVHQHIAVTPESPAVLNPDVPEVLAEIVLKLLSKEPASRYLSAYGLKRDLERCHDSLVRTGKIEAFEIGLQDPSGRFLVPQKLYGRETEVGILRGSLERVATGLRVADGEPGIAFVSGLPGIGKTALIRDLRAPTVAHQGWFCAGKFDQYRRDVPYRAIIEALRDILGQLLAESDRLLDRFRAEAAGGLGENAALLCGLVPELNMLLGPQPVAPKLDAGAARERLDRAFQDFLGVFAILGRPLVLFLDDLQWADEPSLEVMHAVATNPGRSHLLIVGAYRHTEVTVDHAVKRALRGFEDAGLHPVSLFLEPLDRNSVESIVADTVDVPRTEAAALADLVSEKTAGNPFFVGELLRSLNRDGLLRFKEEHGRWVWDLAEIAAVGITDNVVELMTEQLGKLPEQSRDLVQLASCIGARFDLDFLARAFGAQREEAGHLIEPAVDAGLVVPIDAAHKYAAALSTGSGLQNLNPRYRFLHDRVQQAAYGSLPEADRDQRHLDIGRQLLRSSTDEECQESLLVIVEHLNQGCDLIEDPEERKEVARLDLEAGRRAMTTLAFGFARRTLRTGLSLLDDDAWRSEYELTLQLHSEACRAALLTQKWDEIDELAATARAHARSLADRIPLEQQRVAAGISQNKYVEAVSVARELLLELGVRLPAKPNQVHIIASLIRTRLTIGKRTTAELLTMPALEDERVAGAMELLMNATAPAYFGVPSMFPLIIFEMVRLSVRHGNSRSSAYAYSVYGMILCGKIGDIEGGYSFGELGRQILDQYGEGPLFAKICMIWNGFVRHWRDPLRESAPALEIGLTRGISHGDAEYGVYCGNLGFYLRFLSGEELALVLREYAQFEHQIIATSQEQSLPLQNGWNQVVKNFMTVGAPHAAIGEMYDVEKVVPDVLEKRNYMAVVYGCIGDAMLGVYFGDLRRAWDKLMLAEQYLDSVMAMFLNPIHSFFTGLVAARLLAQGEAPRGTRKALRRHLAKLRRWARFNPANLDHKLALLLAEQHVLAGRGPQAIARFEEAAVGARREGFVHEEALAQERLGDFYRLAGNREDARTSYGMALALYRRWGAWNKVQALVEDRAGWISAEDANSGLKDESVDTSRELDALAAVKAARSLSGEIERERLVTRMMALVLECAGAESGALLFMHFGSLALEGRGRVYTPAEIPPQPIQLEDCVDLPRTVIDYVQRTGEPLLLDDACEHEVFGRDPYIVAERTRSVLCSPVSHQGELQGVVYLENNLAKGVFTPARTEIVEVLAGQLGVSIENARLFEEQGAMVESARRFVPSEFLEMLDRRSIMDVKLGDVVRTEISILFSDVQGFTSWVEAFGPEESIRFVNRYLSAMEPAITRNGGFVDSYVGDAIMALFARGADAAVDAAVEMHRALQGMNIQRESAGEQPIHMGVGVNTGDVMLGTVGAERRLKCGVVGDAVNLAARVESLTRTYRVGVLASEHTIDRLSDRDRHDLRHVARVRVVGREAPVTLYEVFDVDEPRQRDIKREQAGRYEEAIAHFYGRRFEDARSLMLELAAALPDDAVLGSFLERTERLIAEPAGPEWSGAQQLLHK